MNNNQDNAALVEKIAAKILQDIEDEEKAEAEKAAQEKLNSKFGGVINEAFRVSMAAKFWNNFK